MIDMKEPSIKRAVAFFDGQNLFNAAKSAFGYSYPNYNPSALAARVCENCGWELVGVRFYTGLPEPSDPRLGFWTAKLAAMGAEGVDVFTRDIRYRSKTVRLPDGAEHTLRIGEEKGIDVRIAVDIIRLALRDEYDVALIFSQDQDLSEVANEVRAIAAEKDRWIKVSSAFPAGSTNVRGIERTDWIRIERSDYDRSIDLRDYRPKRR